MRKISYHFSKTERCQLNINRRPGFTLIELLVAVTIFAALIIVVLGSLARTSLSLASIQDLAQRSQAARTITDQLNSDWHYLYTSANVTDRGAGVSTANCLLQKPLGSDTNYCVFRGYSLHDDRLVLLLQYPGQPTTELVKRIYTFSIPDNATNRQTLLMTEFRHCNLTDSAVDLAAKDIVCGVQSLNNQNRDLVPTNLALSNDSAVFASKFTGLIIDPTRGTTGLLRLNLTIKSANNAALSCDKLAPGSCYSVETVVTTGVVR